MKIYRAFAENRRHARTQRRINDIRMPDNPADVRHTPENIVASDIEKVRQMISYADHIPADRVNYAFRFAGRPRSVKNK